MNIWEVLKGYKLAPEGTIGTCGGMAMCASCQCYVTSMNYQKWNMTKKLC